MSPLIFHYFCQFVRCLFVWQTDLQVFHIILIWQLLLTTIFWAQIVQITTYAIASMCFEYLKNLRPEKVCKLLDLTEDIHSITEDIRSRELCQVPISASAFIPLAGVVGQSLSFSTLQINTKAAAPGFKRDTRGDLSSLSFVIVT